MYDVRIMYFLLYLYGSFACVATVGILSLEHHSGPELHTSPYSVFRVKPFSQYPSPLYVFNALTERQRKEGEERLRLQGLVPNPPWFG